jgi:hypothetical protein
MISSLPFIVKRCSKHVPGQNQRHQRNTANDKLRRNLPISQIKRPNEHHKRGKPDRPVNQPATMTPPWISDH